MPTLRKATAPLAATGLLIGGVAVIASLQAHGLSADGWQMAARYTARASFFLFITVYLIAPASQLLPHLAVLMRERRGLGLAFAGAHFVHLGALIAFFQVSGHTPALLTVTLGGLAYVLIGLMALTSNEAAVRTLGPANWRRLHTLGLHYVWFIFAATYARRIAANPDMLEYVALLAIALTALAIRLSVAFTRKPQPS